MIDISSSLQSSTPHRALDPILYPHKETGEREHSEERATRRRWVAFSQQTTSYLKFIIIHLQYWGACDIFAEKFQNNPCASENDVWSSVAQSSQFCGCTTPSVVSSLGINFEGFDIRIFFLSGCHFKRLVVEQRLYLLMYCDIGVLMSVKVAGHSFLYLHRICHFSKTGNPLVAKFFQKSVKRIDYHILIVKVACASLPW